MEGHRQEDERDHCDEDAPPYCDVLQERQRRKYRRWTYIFVSFIILDIQLGLFLTVFPIPTADVLQISLSSLREIKLLKRLHHENIVNLKDVIVRKVDMKDRLEKAPSKGRDSAEPDKVERGEYNLILEYVDHDLAGLLNSNIYLTVPEIKCCMLQILEGVAYCHRRRIMHRDLKPGNILLDNFGNVKIADFGLARKFDRGRRNSLNVITSHYRPPEIYLHDKSYTFAADMWSLGCVLAELFVLRPFFKGDSDEAQVIEIFRACGTPSDQTWPEWEDLPYAAAVADWPKFKPNLEAVFRRRLGKRQRYCTSMGIHLLNSLLQLDPRRRPTAVDALAHPWFTEEPLPCRKEEMRVLKESMHNFTVLERWMAKGK